MSDKYILKGKRPIPCNDLLKWADWMQTANCVVRKDTAKVTFAGKPVGEIMISTVFLGLDHSFGGDEPLLFETIVFGGPLDQEMERCTTWEAAEKMHEKMIERVKLAEKTQFDELY